MKSSAHYQHNYACNTHMLLYSYLTCHWSQQFYFLLYGWQRQYFLQEGGEACLSSGFTEPKVLSCWTSRARVLAWNTCTRIFLRVRGVVLFLNVLKIRIVLFVWGADGFHNFWPSFCEEDPKYSFCFLLWNYLLIVKILPETIFRKLVPAFCRLSKNCSESPLWSWILFRKPSLNEHRRKFTNERQGKPEQKFVSVSKKQTETS